MRSSDLTIRRVSFQHNPINRYLLQSIKIFLSLHAASIDSNIQIKLYDLLDLVKSASEGMHNPRRKSMPVFLDNIIEVIPCVSVMQVHGQFELLSKVEVKGKYL